MRFVRRAGFGLFLACTPLFGVGCASLSPKISTLPTVTRQRTESQQFQMAQDAERKGDYQQARKLYASLQKQSPRTPVYSHRMGVACTQIGDHKTAAKYFDHARRLDPNNSSLLTDMGYAAYVQRDFSRAETLLSEAVRLKPDNTRAINNLAMVHGYQGRYEDCLATFKKANSESQSLSNLAYVYSQRSETERAVECYRQAAALDPQNKAALSGLAHLCPNEPLPAPVTTIQTANSSAPVKPSVPPLSATADPPPRHASEFEVPVVKHVPVNQVSLKSTGDRPRDRVEDVELPFFEDGEPNERPAVAAAYEQSSGNQSEFEKPLIVPYDADANPFEVVQEKLASESTAQTATANVDDGAWQSDEEPRPRPLPPQPLIEDEESDELARVFVDDDNRTETPMSDAEELAGLEWVKDEQAALAASQPDQSEATQSSQDDGLKGFCPVAIRDERRLVPAVDEFSCEHQSQMFRFSSAEALAKFQAHPEHYAPVAGGLDVVAVRQGESVANGTLDYAVWYRHRLHLFSTAENLASFRATPRSFGSVP